MTVIHWLMYGSFVLMHIGYAIRFSQKNDTFGTIIMSFLAGYWTDEFIRVVFSEKMFQEYSWMWKY